MSDPLDARWRAAHTLRAPHRLGFVLAMLLLVSSALWWGVVQLDHVSTVVALPYAMSPSLVYPQKSSANPKGLKDRTQPSNPLKALPPTASPSP